MKPLNPKTSNRALWAIQLAMGMSYLSINPAFATTGLKTSLHVDGVLVSTMNAMDPEKSGSQDCTAFKGTLHQNTIYLSPHGEGGSGKYQHTILWKYGSGYEEYNGDEEQFTRIVGEGGNLAIDLPALKDDIPYVQQSFLVITKDLASGATTTAEKTFPVSRPVILSQSGNPTVMATNCYQRYPAYESTVGVISNGTTNPSQLTIKQGIQRSWDVSSGSSYGFYVSPLSLVSYMGFSLGNLISWNKNYFSSVSKQTIESFEVSSGYQLSPGDFAQIYTQRTRYVTNYDATMIDGCGNVKIYPGAYKLQWWGFSYHAFPVNPFDKSPANPNNIGAKPMNTCSKELTPDFDSASSQFYQMNR